MFPRRPARRERRDREQPFLIWLPRARRPMLPCRPARRQLLLLGITGRLRRVRLTTQAMCRCRPVARPRLRLATTGRLRRVRPTTRPNVPTATCTAASASLQQQLDNDDVSGANYHDQRAVGTTCTVATASSSNSYTTTTCSTANVTTNVPVQTALRNGLGNGSYSLSCDDVFDQ